MYLDGWTLKELRRDLKGITTFLLNIRTDMLFER